MTIQRAYKTELSPNDVQRSALLQQCGAARFVYNWGLARKQAQREDGEKPLSAQKLDAELRRIIDTEYPWLREVPSHVRQSALADLDKAYSNFFRRLKAGRVGKAAGFPKFKSRRNGIGSFRVYAVTVEQGHIRLPCIGPVRLAEQGYIPLGRYGDGGATKIVSSTVSERAGRWYVSVQVEQDIPEPQLIVDVPLGVHMGVRVLATDSQGRSFHNPRPLAAKLRKLKRLSRSLSRKQKDGRNRDKARQRIATLHARIVDTRRHAQHYVSHVVTRKPRVVVVENWGVAGMMGDRWLARALSDSGVAEIVRQIGYKSSWRGGTCKALPRAYPSTRRCSDCGAVRSAAVIGHQWACQSCGVQHDRELNAARNLAAMAAATDEQIEMVLAASRADNSNACGGGRSGSVTLSETAPVEAGIEQPRTSGISLEPPENGSILSVGTEQ